jgi:hypothetical protein
MRKSFKQLVILFSAIAMVAVGVAIRNAKSSTPTPARLGHRSGFNLTHEVSPGKVAIHGVFEIGVPEPEDETRTLIVDIRKIADGVVSEPAVLTESFETITIRAGDHDFTVPIHRAYEIPSGAYQVLVSSWVPGKVVTDKNGIPFTRSESETSRTINIP